MTLHIMRSSHAVQGMWDVSSYSALSLNGAEVRP